MKLATKLINDIFSHIESSFGFNRYEDIKGIADWLDVIIEKDAASYIKSKRGYRYKLDIADKA
jgi:hypothetical protein